MNKIFRMNRNTNIIKNVSASRYHPFPIYRNYINSVNSVPTLHPSSFFLHTSKNASSLITTLLVVVVLSTIVVAFMQSMSIERSVAKSSNNIYQANLLADAALSEAIQRLSAITNSGPYAAIYDQDSSGSPYLFLAKRIPKGNVLVTSRIPLFSTTVTPFSSFENLSNSEILTSSQTITDRDNLGNDLTRNIANASDITCNLNSPAANFPAGLVGLMNGAEPRSLPVNWTYLKDDTGRVIGRYAFWIDDECSKIDIRYAGQTANSIGNHQRGKGTNLAELSLLSLTNSPLNVTTTEIANILQLRNVDTPQLASILQYPLSSGGGIAPETWQRIRPYVTIYSLHDDRSPNGKRKLNLNTVVTEANTPNAIEQETFAIRDAITNNLPNFGKRFYSAKNGSSTIPSLGDQQIYATRIAANIRDFIDKNNTATIIQSDDTAYIGNADNFIPYETLDSDLPVAFGKEKGPFLSEYFRITRVITPTPHPPDPTKSISLTVRFAHYIELHNPSGRIITFSDLGPDPFIILSNRQKWNNNSPNGEPSILRPADIKIRLPNNFSIAPGGFAVITTDGPPWRDSQLDYLGSSINRYVITHGTNAGQWELVNTGGKTQPLAGQFEDYAIITDTDDSNRYAVQNNNTDPTYASQRERLIFGNSNGLIDYTLRIFAERNIQLGRNAKNPSWQCTFLADSATELHNTTSGADTAPRFTRGDVRSNTETSMIGDNTSACWKDGGCGYGSALPDEQETLGSVNYHTSQDTQSGVARWRQWWYEYTSDPAGNHFIADAPISSVADLGSIYDPVRYDISGFRSQGATLRIGHSDSATNNRANSSSSGYTNWLGGRGSDDVTSIDYARNAFLLLDVFRTDDNTSGRINPNSLARDTNGFVFRAVLDKFSFETATTNQASSTLSGLSLDATNTIAALSKFCTNSANGYFVSVGDLSRVPIFFTSTNALASVSMLNVSDAGREEFLRRSANLLTTQSLAYTIFIRAQAGHFERQNGIDHFRVRGNATREVVLQLHPHYDPSISPTTPAAPTNWSIATPRTQNY